MTHPSPSKKGGDYRNLFSDLETFLFINNKLTLNNFKKKNVPSIRLQMYINKGKNNLIFFFLT
jgi:hypothetical protein